MARRAVIAAGALAVTAGLVGGLGVGARGLLHHQAGRARALIGKPLGELAPSADRTYQKKYGKKQGQKKYDDRIELLMLGDSIAAGLGADRPKDTLGGRLARGLAKNSQRAVRLTTAAVVGAESFELAGQLDALPAAYRPHLAVIVVGGNDVTHRVPVAESVGYLEEAIGRLRARGAEVVVGTCPDLGALRAVPQPLRALGSRASRQLAQAQAAAAVRAGAHPFSLAEVVGPVFITHPDEMFSLDRFHPSGLGYRRTATAMLPAAIAALGLQDPPASA